MTPCHYCEQDSMLHFIVIISLMLISLLLNDTASANYTSSKEEQYFVTITYQKDFPYREYYNKDLIPGCKKIYTNRPILRCKEYIQLMRPVTLIKTWQRTQKKIGYLPITLPEFNIFNIPGKIISIIPAVTYSKHLLSETNSTGHMVTGKFIRHSDKVGHYMFTTGKDSAIDNINATDNHLFYVKNKNKFIPVSKIESGDSLINKEGKTVYLKHAINSKNEDEKLMNKTPEIVYNLEVSSSHTYFIGSHKILVHNTCTKKQYFDHLNSANLICQSETTKHIYLKFSEGDMPGFFMPVEDNKYLPIELNSYGRIRLPRTIKQRLFRMGFLMGKKGRSTKRLVLAVPMSRSEYEFVLPFIRSFNGRVNKSETFLKDACKRARDFLYDSIWEKIEWFTHTGRGSSLEEKERLLTREGVPVYFKDHSIQNLMDFLQEKDALCLTDQTAMKS